MALNLLKTLLSPFFILCIFFYSCNTVTERKEATHQSVKNQKPFRVIGFYKGSIVDIDKYHLEKLTHLIFCFTHLKGNEMALDNAKDSILLRQMIDLKKNYPNLKVFLSFGGWGGCESCSDGFSVNEKRNQFVISTKNLLAKYHADGIDLDWESPVIGGYGKHKHSVDD